MYAAVANRTHEIGTLRALDFRRRNILTAFLIDMGLAGGFLPAIRAARLDIVEALRSV